MANLFNEEKNRRAFLRKFPDEQSRTFTRDDDGHEAYQEWINEYARLMSEKHGEALQEIKVNAQDSEDGETVFVRARPVLFMNGVELG